MTFSVTNSFTNGAVIDADELNTNFDDVESLVNGGLLNENIDPNAAIDVSKLSASSYEFVFTWQMNDAVAGIDTLPNTAYVILGTIPYDANVLSYSITGIEMVSYKAAGVTAVIGDLKRMTTSATIGSGAGTDLTIQSGITTGTSAGVELNRYASPSNASWTPNTGSSQVILYFDVTQAGGSWATTDSFALTLKIKATLRT